MKATVTKYTEPRLSIPKRSYRGVVPYDIDNNYPLRVRDIVQNSGMGKTCVGKYRKFIFGEGFSDPNFANTIINKARLTPNKLLNKLSENFAYHGGFAIHVNWNPLFQISEINFQPFLHVRKTSEDNEEYPNMYAVCKWWHLRNIKAGDIVYIDRFCEDPEIIQEQVDKAGGWDKYNGQIFYYSTEGDEYPLSIFDAVLEDMQTDSQTKIFKFRNVTSNFMASHVIITDKTESGEAETDVPTHENIQKESSIVQQLQEFQGAEDAMKVIVIEKDTPEQSFDIKKLDIQNVDNLFQWTENSTRDNIRQAFMIPSILLQTTPGKLGASTEFIDATNYYNLITNDERLKISEAMELLHSYFSSYVEGQCKYDIVPKSGIENSEDRKSIMLLLNSVVLTIPQKIGALVELFGLDLEQATKIMGNGAPNNG